MLPHAEYHSASPNNITNQYPKRATQATVSPNPKAIIISAQIRRMTGSATDAEATGAVDCLSGEIWVRFMSNTILW